VVLNISLRQKKAKGKKQKAKGKKQKAKGKKQKAKGRAEYQQQTERCSNLDSAFSLLSSTEPVNTEQLRKSVKDRWLAYYAENRDWVARLGVWVNCDGKRRPSSGFILGTLSVLEPELTALFPLVVDLSSNPDRIVVALGLNFNPDEELASLPQSNGSQELSDTAVKLLPAATTDPLSTPAKATTLASRLDEFCHGRGVMENGE
jgi:hypothetical protein